ncbi:MAG: FixH family protein [Deltaproteobacteria bacterium]|jgi:hypothetical protein|nr:FixH family protein [Deltaproteobacteria bacterium]
MRRKNFRATTYAVVVLAVMFSSLESSQARDYRVRKKTGGLTFDVRINRNPPVLGDNEIRIAIKDAQGNPVKGLRVFVNYYMPPMPGMPPMNYNIPAKAENTEYRATMDLIMTGPWNIVLRLKYRGRMMKIVFPIDVR